MEDRNYCVYTHRNKVNGKRYIGQSNDVNNRWSGDGKRYEGCKFFYSAIKKYGWDAFDHYIIQDHLTKEEADELEKLNIAFFNTTDSRYGYNLACGGTNGSNQKGKIWVTNNTTEQHLITPEQLPQYLNAGFVKGRLPASEQMKEKLRKINTGRVFTKEQCKKVSDALKGRVFSEEHRRHLSESAKRRKQTEETKQKLREINTGKHYSEETKAKHRKAKLGNTYAVGNTNVRGYVCLTNGDIETRVPPEKVAEFEQKGFKRGRKPRNKQTI